ncbi:MAG: cupredoxin domain-containing protein [Nitrososphaerota archaeon]|nr:cupredoxin domain-containing protein [Nitrososphaerota archaeon]
MSSKQGSTAVGIIVAILIIGAVGSIGYYQVVVAPGEVNTSSTAASTLPAVTCPSAACANVSIISGASTPPSGYSSGQTTTYGYAPDKIVVVIGVNNTVYWVNNDAAPHTVTSVSTPPIFNSGEGGPLSNQGGTYQYTFTTPGTYFYYCSYHPWMQGEVVVLAGTGSASGASA